MSQLKHLLFTMGLCLGLLFQTQADIDEAVSNYALVYSSPLLYGKVTNSVNGEPVVGAQVLITVQSGPPITMLTQISGFYTLSDFPVGPFLITVTAPGFQAEYSQVQSVTTCTQIDFPLTPLSSDFVAMSSVLRVYANTILEAPANYYTLIGDVNINGIVFLQGPVTIDKRPHNPHPILSGSASIEVHNILEANYTLLQGTTNYSFIGVGDRLVCTIPSALLTVPFTVLDIPLKLLGMTLNQGGTKVTVALFPELPFPFADALKKSWKEKNLADALVFTGVSIFREYTITQGVFTWSNLHSHSFDYNTFKISSLSFLINTETNVLEGTAKFHIPGGKKAGKDTLADPDLQNLAVLFGDSSGQVFGQSTLGQPGTDFFPSKTGFLSMDVRISYTPATGSNWTLHFIDNIPLGESGLMINLLQGNIIGLTDRNNWLVSASVGILTGLELPGRLGPVRFSPYSVTIKSPNVFTSQGSFNVFNFLANHANVAYNSLSRSLNAEANLNLAGMLYGRAAMNIRGGQFTGEGLMTSIPPPDLPRRYRWLAGKTLPPARALIDDYNITTDCHYLSARISQRFEYGKQEFPYFHYYIGQNYLPLTQIWKGHKLGKTALQFLVPENCQQFFVVAEDSLQMSRPDFQLIAPNGNTYDSTFAHYYTFDAISQTLVVIDNPIPGEWMFLSNDTLNLRFETFFQNQQPVGLISMPAKKESKSNNLALQFTDYADTLQVAVFYDTDSEGFNGNLIQEFQVENNASLSFEWQNQEVPDGEYFIYFVVDDRKNAPAAQYAPGSILLNRSSFSEIPQNVQLSLQNDSLLVQWDTTGNMDILLTALHIKDAANGQLLSFSVSDTSMAKISGLNRGHPYQLWCCFVDQDGKPGPKSDVIDFQYLPSDGSNFPPYFMHTGQSRWMTVAGESSQYNLTAGDADNDPLVFSLIGDTLGILINGSQLQWTPAPGFEGNYQIAVQVHDGAEADTLFLQLIVFSPGQTAVTAGFNSINLYENDNKFIRIRNHHSQAASVWASLTNLRTSEQTEVACRKVDAFEYIGGFNLSFVSKSDLEVANGDTLMLSYAFEGQTHTAYARYDSLPQPSDIFAPAAISDLQLLAQKGNNVKLSWTAPGNNGNDGKAYKYDIRYAFSPILDENDFLLANRILTFPYPSLAGQTDTLLIGLDTLAGILDQDSIWFSIKAEDENQNRGNLGNNLLIPLRLTPNGMTSSLQDIHYMHLAWNGSIDHPDFQYYKLFRRISDGAFSLLKDTLLLNAYVDNLYAEEDEFYQYAVQAVYTTGLSDTLISEPVLLDRFVDLTFLCQLEDQFLFDSIQFVLSGLDTIYSQEFSRVTNPNGIVLLGDVFRGKYTLSLSKPGYVTHLDTLDIDPEHVGYSFTLLDALKPRSLSGQLKYMNAPLTPMDQVEVFLVSLEGSVLDSSTSDASGTFGFIIAPGTYRLLIETGKAWGGVNAIDALAVLRHSVEIQLLHGLPFAAADVNGSGNLNAVDGLLIVRRYTELITSFVIPDWVISTPVVTMVPGFPLLLDIRVLCAGDANGSYIPPGN